MYTHSDPAVMFYVESVEILELDLANQTPFVKTMKVTDGPSSSNPSRDSSRTTLVANLDVGIMAPDSRIVLKARLGGKWSVVRALSSLCS